MNIGFSLKLIAPIIILTTNAKADPKPKNIDPKNPISVYLYL